MQPDIDRPDPHFQHVAGFGPIDEDRSSQRVIATAVVIHSLIFRIQLAWDFLFRNAELLEVTRIPRGRF